VTLRFQSAISDGNSLSDGVIFGVQVNGQTQWKATILPDAGWTNGSVDLTPYAGSTIKLRLLTHPGVALKPYFDSACWNAIQITTDFSSTATAQLQLPTNSVAVPQITPNATLTPLQGQTATVRVPVPGKFAVFTQPPPLLSVGSSLLTTSFTVWETTGGIPIQSVYENSGTISSVSSSGVSRTAIAAIPRHSGQTILTSAVTLSPSASALSLGYALADAPAGADPIQSYSGVNFIVRANGTQVFNQAVSTTGWATSQIDVSAWRGLPVLFELIVDANQNQLFDFAYYSDLTIH
jgi:hypothetical protein